MTDGTERIAFVDDDEILRLANRQTLELAGHAVAAFPDAASALRAIDADYPGVVVTDVRMPGMDGLQLFARLRALDPELPVILVTGHGDVPMAVAALKDGAWDFLTKPFSAEQLLASVRRALAARRLVLENRALRRAADLAAGEPLIGETPAIVALRRQLRQLADTDVDVLLEGETGTGKELAATLLHRWSKRRGRPFVPFHAASLALPLAQSELVGHQDGVVPGVRLSRMGRIEAADGGTLFLDELETMAEPLQCLLLRVLEEREVVPLGSDHARAVDVRVIATVGRDPQALVAAGALRGDLFFRLDTVHLRLPPLRERRDDVPLLLAHLLRDSAEKHGVPVPVLDGATRHHILYHDWPGNVRELGHFAERLVLGLHPKERDGAEAMPGLAARVQRFEAEEIRAALARHRGRIAAVLGDFGVPRKTLYDKLAKYGINPADYRA